MPNMCLTGLPSLAPVQMKMNVPSERTVAAPASRTIRMIARP